MFVCSTRGKGGTGDSPGMFDLWVKVQAEMLRASSSLPLSGLQCLGAVCRLPFLLPFPPSESSLQEIKGFKMSVSYGAPVDSGIVEKSLVEAT